MAELLKSRILATPHKHLVFTIPEELRIYFRKDRHLLKDLSDRVVKVLKETIYGMNKGQHFETGLVNVIHTFGRDLKWNPHVHVIMSMKCLGKTEDRTIKYLSYEKLIKFWQKELIDMMVEAYPTQNMRKLKNKLYRQKENGFYVYAKGEINEMVILVKYIARYAGRPAIAESRITGYDGESVTFRYTPHGKKEEVIETVSAEEFIKKLIIHIPDTNFKMIRNYGIYSRNNIKAKRIETRKMAKLRLARLRELKTWQFRIIEEFDRNPLICECGKTMKLSDIIIADIERHRRSG